ncbi:MAG: NHL repeat-containing protein [Melioribacteraceae bacterium]|nr:NHL repeat-containing protein [Melioribacteraceae bacterium]
MYKLIYLCSIFSVITLQAQIFSQIAEFGSFQEAVSFSINQQGNIYVTDASTNEVTKFDKNGKELIVKGGYGWDTESFDNPCDIIASTLNVYVADKNNNRIVFLDKDLNYLSELNNDNTDFAYPLSIGSTIQGDLLLLDSDNSKILKLNIDGEYILKFGDYESGDYTLNAPKRFRISDDFNVFVLDDSSLVIFDQFGTGLKKAVLNCSCENLSITHSNLVLNSSTEIFHSNSDLAKIKLNKITIIPSQDKIMQAAIFDKILYVLTSNNIILYKQQK